ncbi:MAG: hypothetical protein LQ350_005297 [Teloschistes chrysophthalmus]|nr:MAG: hypothetical protein LQ350_005297 [Niorma chrysophthalma]
MAYHRMMRSHVKGRFAPANLLASQAPIDDCIDIFIQRMKELGGERTVDFEIWAKYWAFDANSAMNFGRPFGFMAKGEDIQGIIRGNDRGFRFGALIGQVPSLNKFLLENKALMRFLSYTAGITDPTADFVTMIKEKVAEAEATREQKWSLLGWLRKEQHNPRKQGLNEACLIIHLANYFQAAIKEAMRLAPTNALPLERIVPSEGLTIGDYNIPSGTIIGASAYIVHRDQQIYGSDVNTFRPERWLDPDTTTTRKMQSHFFAFGHGERGCPGQALAIMMMTKFLFRILQTFDIEWASDQDQWNLRTWWMPEQHGLTLRFLPVAQGPL